MRTGQRTGTVDECAVTHTDRHAVEFEMIRPADRRHRVLIERQVLMLAATSILCARSRAWPTRGVPFVPGWDLPFSAGVLPMLTYSREILR